MKKKHEHLEARNRKIDDIFLNLYTDKSKVILSGQRFYEAGSHNGTGAGRKSTLLQELMRMIRQSDV